MKQPVRSHGFTALGPLHEAFARLTGKLAMGVAALLGALGAIAFAPFHFTPVLVLSFVGLIWMLDGARSHRKWGKAVFARCWAFGFGFFLVGMYWTVSPFLVEPEKTAIFVFMPLILLPGGLALIWGAAGAMAGAFWSSSPSRVFVFALFFALAEFVRGHLFGGFPWNLPGTTWAPGGAMSQAASLGGVYWLTLLTVFIVSAPAALVDTRDYRGLIQRVLPSALAVILFAVGWSWGAQRLATPTQLSDQHVTLMDVGVPQGEKFVGGPNRVLEAYLDLLQAAESEPGDFVVWPEGAIPTYLLQDPIATDAVADFLGARTLMTGTTRYQPGADDALIYYNSLAVMDAGAGRSGPTALYDKHRLVPFGELPAARIIPGGQAISGILPGAIQQLATSGFQAGTGPAVIQPQSGRQEVPPFIALICYEGLYPSISRIANNQIPADWIVLVSNDAWFGAGLGPAQHYAQNRYRSIETGLPMARAAARGASGVIDGYGREVLRAKPVEPAYEGWKTTYGRARLPVRLEGTFYQTRAGLVLFWLTISLFAGLAFLSWRR